MTFQTTLHASLTRISDLKTKPFQVTPLSRDSWASGDYVVGQVTACSHASLIELTSGRMAELSVGDHLIGALGVRAATLEAVGSWEKVGDDGRMQAMTAAGIMGRVTSLSSFIPTPIDLQYRGHVRRDNQTVKMANFATSPSTTAPAFGIPVVLLIGTSMSSGKTTSARVIIRCLKRMGLRVVGAKFTGAGRYRDILAMSDAGADAIFDFVDEGLPSTVCEEATFRSTMHRLLARIAAAEPDVLVAEAGASPLEPYNGAAAVEELGRNTRCTVLCASDPYAVMGVINGFGFHPDFVSGVATSTSAGVDVIVNLAGVRALNLLDPASDSELEVILRERLGLP